VAKSPPPVKKRRGRKRPADRCSRYSHAPGCRLGRPLCRWRRAESPKHRPCLCSAYPFPHRPGSGYCGHPERFWEDELAARQERHVRKEMQEWAQTATADDLEDDDCPFTTDGLTDGNPPSDGDDEPF